MRLNRARNILVVAAIAIIAALVAATWRTQPLHAQTTIEVTEPIDLGEPQNDGRCPFQIFNNFDTYHLVGCASDTMLKIQHGPDHIWTVTIYDDTVIVTGTHTCNK